MAAGVTPEIREAWPNERGETKVSFSTTSSSFPTWAPEYTPEWLAVIYGVGWMVLGFVLPQPHKKLE